jgi:hypothetical protein
MRDTLTYPNPFVLYVIIIPLIGLSAGYAIKKELIYKPLPIGTLTAEILETLA